MLEQSMEQHFSLNALHDFSWNGSTPAGRGKPVRCYYNTQKAQAATLREAALVVSANATSGKFRNNLRERIVFTDKCSRN
jgi:hypothetical protein